MAIADGKAKAKAKAEAEEQAEDDAKARAKAEKPKARAKAADKEFAPTVLEEKLAEVVFGLCQDNLIRLS